MQVSKLSAAKSNRRQPPGDNRPSGTAFLDSKFIFSDLSLQAIKLPQEQPEKRLPTGEASMDAHRTSRDPFLPLIAFVMRSMIKTLRRAMPASGAIGPPPVPIRLSQIL